MDSDISLAIPILAFVAAVCLGGAVIVAAGSRRRTVHARLTGGSQGSHAYTRSCEAPILSPFVGTLAKIGLATSGKKNSKSLRLKMVRAGFSGPAAIPVFLGAKLTLLLAAMFGAGVAVLALGFEGRNALLLILCSSGLAFFIPNILLDLRAKSRSNDVRGHLPDVVDLLEISVSGGMSLDGAWNAVAEEVRSVSPLLADEMALANMEMHLGEDRGAAIRNMAQRTGADELASLVAVLVQSERFGTSISDALRSFASSMRELRSMRAEEYAEKMAVKMLIPMVVLIFPVVIVVAVGPAAITLVKVFSSM
jgi:tight adherence protein C